MLGVRDFTVWNEPSSTAAVSPCCPFWVGTARQYAELYAATYRAIKAACNTTVRVGAAINGALSQENCAAGGWHAAVDHCFDWHILSNISAMRVPLDFAEYHWYGRRPVQLAWNLVGKGVSSPFPASPLHRPIQTPTK